MIEMDLFDVALSKVERDDALYSVENNSKEFMEEAHLCISRLSNGEYTGEDIRVIITRLGLAPNHCNAWGALINNAVRSKLLIGTGRYVAMASRTSHARKTQLYCKST